MMLWMLSTEALALSCFWGLDGFNFEQGEVVPPDVVFVASHTFAEPDAEFLGIEIVDDAGVAVPANVQWEPFVVRVVPDELLEPGSYRLVDDDGYSLGKDGWAFEVAEQPAPEPLDAPTDLDTRRKVHRNGGWGVSKGVELSFSEVEGASHYEIELARDEAFEDPSVAVTPRTDLFVGNDVCGANIANYDHGVESYVRVRAVGIDGSVSDWTMPVVTRPNALARVVPGCAVVGGSPIPILGLAMSLGLLAMGRRR